MRELKSFPGGTALGVGPCFGQRARMDSADLKAFLYCLPSYCFITCKGTAPGVA